MDDAKKRQSEHEQSATRAFFWLFGVTPDALRAARARNRESRLRRHCCPNEEPSALHQADPREEFFAGDCMQNEAQNRGENRDDVDDKTDPMGTMR